MINADEWVLRAERFADEGDTIRAKRCLEKAMEIEPTHSTAVLQFGDLLCDEKDLDAIEVFAASIMRLGVDSRLEAEMLCLKAFAQFERGEFQAAQFLLLRAMKLFQGPIPFHFLLCNAMCMTQKNPEEGLEILLELEVPKDAHHQIALYLALGDAYSDLQKTEESAYYYELADLTPLSLEKEESD